MEDLDVEGLFWLEDKPDDKVAGRLTFTAQRGGTLNLIGAFHEAGRPADPDEVVRIHGIAGAKRRTLENCHYGGQHVTEPGAAHERYHPSIILSGGHFSEEQLSRFRSVYVQMRHLEHWIPQTRRAIDHPPPADGDPPGRTTIIHTRLERSVLRTELGELELDFPDTLSLGMFEATIKQSCSLGLSFNEPSPLQDAFHFSGLVQDLVTIGTYTPAEFTSIRLAHNDTVQMRTAGQVIDDLVDVHTLLHVSNAAADSENGYPSGMLFTFDDIGGLDGVARWLAISEKYSHVVGRLAGHWYAPGEYTDSRFFSIVTAAGALEKARPQGSDLTFRERLVRIAKHAGKSSSMVVDDVGVWAKEILDIRNEIAHDGLHEDKAAKRLYWLSESVYLLTVISLLRECGVADDTFSNMRWHSQFSRVARQLRSNP